MSRTEEISSDVKAVSAAADEARNRAEEALEYARGEIDLAHEHGWDGVGQSISIAGEALEKIVEELAGSGDVFENAARTLDVISERMSHNEVAEQLGLARAELDTGRDTFLGTAELINEALTGAEQAEHQALGTRLNNLREEVEKLSEQLQQHCAEIDSEQEQAQKMGQQEGEAESRKRDDNEEKNDTDEPKDDGGGSSGKPA
ncbi:hypothetical protein LWF15_08870 [Kineosporia rhizophila]|uniref:hypothetical protein n=1 Tax=Kineosporia rhizophila TaxID=84633 RepID=UPI000AD126EA|nr:hypothetical protein [Kineosporia rhizophila]MCE0535622.1 hypothetical protein [Kineosporia rhizophila]